MLADAGDIILELLDQGYSVEIFNSHQDIAIRLVKTETYCAYCTKYYSLSMLRQLKMSPSQYIGETLLKLKKDLDAEIKKNEHP